jgi:hypothetical protein
MEKDSNLEPREETNERKEDKAVAALIHGALSNVPMPEESLLPGIQKRISARTRGRYFKARQARLRDPLLLVVLGALLVLALMTASYLVMYHLYGSSSPGRGDSPRDAQGADQPASEVSRP